jgi:hypothetical protein
MLIAEEVKEARIEEGPSPQTGKSPFAHHGTGRVPPVSLFALWI